MTLGLRLILAGAHRPELQEAAAIARRMGASTCFVPDARTLLEELRTTGADLVLADLDLNLPELLRTIRTERMRVPVLACGIDAPAALAVAAVRAGAADYLPLPPDADLIAAALLTLGERCDRLGGCNAAVVNAAAHASRFARTRLPMLISGEAGTGKEVLARAVHQESRRLGPFVTLDCDGIDAATSMLELFGQPPEDLKAGLSARTGKLEQASGGTLLIRHVDRLGSDAQQQLHACLAGPARVIASTTADLRQCCSEGRFRADLLTELSRITVELPPLRHRSGDIAVLAGEFASSFAHREQLPPPRFSEEALCALRAYAWPGNVRELEQLVHRAVLLASEVIHRDDLILNDGSLLSGGSYTALSTDYEITGLVGRRVEEVERDLILQTLRQQGGNRTAASAILGISIRTMRNKLRSFQAAGFPVAQAS